MMTWRKMLLGLLAVGTVLAVSSCKTAEAETQGEQAAQKLKPIDSSMIKAVGYDAATKMLTVEFVTTGETYVYEDVPEEVYKGLMAAKSKGAYFSKNIKNAYKNTKK